MTADKLHRLARGFAAEWLRPDDPDRAAPPTTEVQEKADVTRGGTMEIPEGRRTASQGGVIRTPAPNPMTFAQFSAVNRQRCESPDGFKHRLDSWSTSDWFLATLGELGEAANNAKKLNRYRDGIPGNKESEAALREKLRKELGDVYVYLDLLAQSLGIDIGAAAVEVFNAKSEELGCPIRMASAASIDINASSAPSAALRGLAAELRERAHTDAKYGVMQAMTLDREYYGTVNAALVMIEIADQLDALAANKET